MVSTPIDRTIDKASGPLLLGFSAIVVLSTAFMLFSDPISPKKNEKKKPGSSDKDSKSSLLAKKSNS